MDFFAAVAVALLGTTGRHQARVISRCFPHYKAKAPSFGTTTTQGPQSVLDLSCLSELDSCAYWLR